MSEDESNEWQRPRPLRAGQTLVPTEESWILTGGQPHKTTYTVEKKPLGATRLQEQCENRWTSGYVCETALDTVSSRHSKTRWIPYTVSMSSGTHLAIVSKRDKVAFPSAHKSRVSPSFRESSLCSLSLTIVHRIHNNFGVSSCSDTLLEKRGP